ncbi:hypothetical protein B0O99DRAFT_612512 [Bisporella sp. PMI_857]|nr:hypothetical protein B0O99DRAFT_612512 [Bisporella sp. PMI_857]
MGLPPWETSDSQHFTFITGANSGLGHSIAARLIEEFLNSPDTPSNKHLILILCTPHSAQNSIRHTRLRAHLRKVAEYSELATTLRKKAKAQGTAYKWEDTVRRVHFLGVEADLCDLKSVYALADRLVNGTVGSPDATTMEGRPLPHGSPGTASYSEDISLGWGLHGIRIPRLDSVILNAGHGGWLGVDYLLATKTILLDLKDSVTWPAFKISNQGALTRPQSTYKAAQKGDEEKQPLLSEQEQTDEPPLGEVFCSNVFGHYILTHELMPLLSRPASESATSGGKIIWIKRLIDLLAFTSELPSVSRDVASYFDTKATVTVKASTETKEALVKPRVFVAHPGIFASDILPLNFILVIIYKFVFLVARWFGKRAMRTNVLAGAGMARWDPSKRCTNREEEHVDLTKEAREDFEILGGQCWREMERLRGSGRVFLESRGRSDDVLGVGNLYNYNQRPSNFAVA